MLASLLRSMLNRTFMCLVSVLLQDPAGNTDLENGFSKHLVLQHLREVFVSGFQAIEGFHPQVFHHLEHQLYRDLHEAGHHDVGYVAAIRCVSV